MYTYIKFYGNALSTISDVKTQTPEQFKYIYIIVYRKKLSEE